ncbi:hypothetical protein L1887_03220 [Cichorium endivia]|nr:hypothetical protein L1887_03220 [Cichorium endivia]
MVLVKGMEFEDPKELKKLLINYVVTNGYALRNKNNVSTQLLFNLHFPPDEVVTDEGEFKRPKRKSQYGYCSEAGLREVACKIGYSSEEFGLLISLEQMRMDELEDAKETPDDMASNFTCQMFDNPQAVLLELVLHAIRCVCFSSSSVCCSLFKVFSPLAVFFPLSISSVVFPMFSPMVVSEVGESSCSLVPTVVHSLPMGGSSTSTLPVYFDCGDAVHMCGYCSALFWYDERVLRLSPCGNIAYS